jgi:hypothetical protein
MLSVKQTGRLHVSRHIPNAQCWYRLSRTQSNMAAGRINQSNEPIGNQTSELEASRTAFQRTAPPRTPLFYQIYANYTKHVGKTQECQRLSKEIRFDWVNQITVRTLVKFLYVKFKTLHNRAKFVQIQFKNPIYYPYNIKSYITH